MIQSQRSFRSRVAAGVVGAALAALLIAVASAPAGAVPIRGLRANVGYGEVTFSATIYSPPTAKHCYANAQAAIVAYNPTRRLKSLGNNRINVCRGGSRGWTSGGVRGRFPMWNIRAGQYAVCLRAVQILRGGRTSAHTECKLFYWPGS